MNTHETIAWAGRQIQVSGTEIISVSASFCFMDYLFQTGNKVGTKLSLNNLYIIYK